VRRSSKWYGGNSHGPGTILDVVILDLSMPGMNGFETAAKIRLIAPLIRIVLFSVHEISTTARWVGADAFVSKSSTPQELALTVNRVLQSGATF
jgi:DNA-binding NarL/FixJ family response regulator